MIEMDRKMSEKVIKLGIVKISGAEYTVHRGGCIMILDKGTPSPSILTFLSWKESKALKKDWEGFSHFIDDDGDISKTKVNDVKT